MSGGGPSSVVGYDAEGRYYTVAASGSTHTNSYFPGTATRANLTTTEGSTTILTRTLYFDRMQRLRGIVTANASGTALSRHGYTLDNAGRRKTATRENGQRWDYGYDTLGQVTSALKKFPDGTTPIPGHAFSYVYDGIGNRKSAVQGGTGMAVAYPEGNTNAINQYKRIETEDGRYILGEAPSGNAVIINGDPTAAARPGGLGFYWKQFTDSNSTAPLWSNDSVASNGVTIAGRTWTPAAVVVPIYDEDGNLKYDGRWDYSWDAENRLIQMKASSAALAAATASGIPCEKLDFAYDSQGRRISKTVSTSTNGTTWTFARNQRFLYDGWNLIAEYSTAEATPNSLTLQATHTWGIDLSGAPQGAGGVGGLLATHLVAAPASACYPAYDGNGNISAWIDGAGVLLGRMDYSPFGQLITQYKFTPTVSTTLSRLGFGFSTKYTDAESGLLYYVLRYYDPVLGRWSSRDLIEEHGGMNIYGFVNNSPVSFLDVLGLAPNESAKPTTWFVDGRGHPSDFFKRAASFIVDKGSYRVKILKSTFKDDHVYTAANNHELRHITSVANSPEKNAVPYKQVFCVTENGKKTLKYFRFNGKEVAVEFFPDKGEIMWTGETAVQLATINAEGTEESKELDKEVADLELAIIGDKNPAKDITDRIVRLKGTSIARKAQIGKPGDLPEWAAFKKAVADEKKKINDMQQTWEWFSPKNVYPELMK